MVAGLVFLGQHILLPHLRAESVSCLLSCLVLMVLSWLFIPREDPWEEMTRTKEVEKIRKERIRRGRRKREGRINPHKFLNLPW